MKLLIVTQVVDTKDMYLSFFHTWIEKLAEQVESIEVICLYEGEHTLPGNVRVHSLGKENGARSSLVYAARFLRTMWKLRKKYDRVFVHMNEEYVLLGGLFWKMLRKPAYLWRNHYAGSMRTRIAEALCANVFYTSRYSYTARFKNAVQMPLGIDLSRFHITDTIARTPRSILFFARFSPSKRPELFIEALRLVRDKGVDFTASLYGSALPEDAQYQDAMKQRVSDLKLDSQIAFHEGVPNAQAAAIYAAHEIFVNCAPSGMYDKTIFEAAASGCLTLSSSEDWRSLTSDLPVPVYFSNSEELASLLVMLLTSGDQGATQMGMQLAKSQDIALLAKRLKEEMM